jgi:hypothetical protein
MAQFKITDQETGMQILVTGDQAPSEADMRSLFNAARKNATQQLSEGLYKRDNEFVKLDKNQQREKVQRLAAAALGTSSDEVDVDSGASLWERTKMDFLPDPRSRMEYLEKKYGSENVNALNIGGKTKMFYRDPNTNKMTMVDEMGASLADFTADIAGEAVTTAGAVGGAIVGSALGPGGTAGGSVMGAAAGAAIGGFFDWRYAGRSSRDISGAGARLGTNFNNKRS